MYHAKQTICKTRVWVGNGGVGKAYIWVGKFTVGKLTKVKANKVKANLSLLAHENVLVFAVRLFL